MDVFLRDDDAGWADDRLLALLDVVAARGLPVHLDWVRLSPAELDERLATEIAGGGPVGVMFHHEEMDGASLDRAADLVDLLSSHRSARVRPMMEVA